jgi:hypothetical protein
MAKPKARYVERRITKLEREIRQIDDDFYGSERSGDRYLYAGMLERKRDDMVRSAVLQMHTAIEDLLNSQIICSFLGVRPEGKSKKLRATRGKAVHRMLSDHGSLGFDMKLNLAVALGVINAPTREYLMELNTLRNKCSHKWLLKEPVRRKRRPKQKKPPLLLFRGNDLHNVSVLKEFMAVYGPMYARMFARYID